MCGVNTTSNTHERKALSVFLCGAETLELLFRIFIRSDFLYDLTERSSKTHISSLSSPLSHKATEDQNSENTEGLKQAVTHKKTSLPAGAAAAAVAIDAELNAAEFSSGLSSSLVDSDNN